VVNEAMLTGETRPPTHLTRAGESVPQVKESIRLAFAEEEKVDLGDDSDPHPVWRRHMVFGGSTLSQHSETSVDEEQIVRGALNSLTILDCSQVGN
jgi:magnesium-transporting ATPase (P-type)